MPEEVNPLEGSINIVDAMLVFACGLMLSLAMYWNVDLHQKGEPVDMKLGRDVSQLPDIRHNLIETQGRGKLYEKLGTVYRDPETGKLFMLTAEQTTLQNQ
ncbi:MAG: DUF2149 domain-containing protein [Bacillota bacterium]